MLSFCNPGGLLPYAGRRLSAGLERSGKRNAAVEKRHVFTLPVTEAMRMAENFKSREQIKNEGKVGLCDEFCVTLAPKTGC